MQRRVIFNEKLLPYLLLAPQLAVTLIFFFWPAGQAIHMSVLSQDAFGQSVTFVGLDNFKEVNDTHGHDEGDQVLRVLAEETRKTIGENDIFARLGGDEFVVVIPERDFTAAKQIIEQLAMNVLAAFRRRGWPVTLSIGALTYNHAAKIPVSPMQQVDQLMYKVKKTGKAAIRHQKA